MNRWLAIAISALAVAAPAHASTVMELSPDALERGADRVVEATVTARRVVWNATHTGLETHATLTFHVDHGTSSLVVVTPGGELDGARQIVFGTPSTAVGERARWFLRERGDGTYRVYGWAQGKWPERHGRFAPAAVAAESPSTHAQFTTNGMVWPAAKIPVQYLIQNAGSQDVSLPDEIAAIDAAFAAWQAVPTAGLAFQNAGMTDLGLGIDGNNVMLFVESGWQFGAEAAAATSLSIIDGQQTADIAVNGQNFTWAIGPPSAGITSNVLDLQAVMTHEIGHFSGMGHTERSFDTMYFSWKPWQGQRTLSIDDKLGLSSVYPVTGDECGTCPTDETCTTHPLGRLCEGTPDPVGTPCNYDRVECDAFCLFTAVDLSTGYCSKFCDTNADCPLTHHCDEASAGSMTVKVCFAGAQPPPPPPCTVDDVCPAGQHCDVGAGACTFECRLAEDCGPDFECDARGSCIALPGDGGGCCQSGREPPLLVLALLAAIAACRRSSRTTPRRPRSR